MTELARVKKMTNPNRSLDQVEENHGQSHHFDLLIFCGLGRGTLALMGGRLIMDKKMQKAVCSRQMAETGKGNGAEQNALVFVHRLQIN